VRDYWDSHPLGFQYVKAQGIEVGSLEFFDHIRPWMTPYKFPDVLPRIERQARRLEGKHLLEVGCGLGFDTVEFLRRNVRVTATDLTPAAVQLTRRHLALLNLRADSTHVENVLDLSFADDTFDAVYAIGVVHHTGNTALAIREIFRVLAPGGIAIVAHLYRRPSWFHLLSRLGKENIEFQDQDAPVIDFYTEAEVCAMFSAFEIEEITRDHYRALPVARSGPKAALYTWCFRPLYNALPETVAKRFAHKTSVVAIKPGR